MTTVTPTVPSAAPAPPNGPAAPKSREVRAGLVLYGGVSLAIYIHGVTYEFFRAVRGQGVYRLIKALTDSDIVVDVISGTSAGGVNGIMLAYALCDETPHDFRDVSDLWRGDGDIRKLMRDPDARDPSSLLDSEGFYQKRLENAFRRMSRYNPEPGEDASRFDELDLFITGTDVHGVWSTQFDDVGHPIEVKNHRAVFHLKHRAGRKCPFDSKGRPEVHEALAKLSRITSCFPGAFAPVHVQKDPVQSNSADGMLQLWGALRREAFFIDGGVIDNKPFTYTLESIFSRVADRAIDRKLFYVDPDPEGSKPSSAVQCPNLLQTVLASLIGIPGYESIADDLRLLETRNRQLKQYKRMVRELEATWAGVPLDLREEAETDNESLRVSGIHSTEQSAKLYDRSRLVHLSERVIQGIFRDTTLEGHDQEPMRQRAAKLIQKFDTIEFNGKELLRRIDAHFRRRRLYRLTYRIYDRLYNTQPEPSPPEAENYRTAWRTVNRVIELLDIVRWVLESFVDDADLDWRKLEIDQVWPLVQCGCYYLLDDRAAPAQAIAKGNPSQDPGAIDRWLGPDQLKSVYAAFRARKSELSEMIRSGAFDEAAMAAAFQSESLLVQVDRYERHMLKRFFSKDDPVCRAYLTFPALDELLFPLEMIGGLHEKDLIEAVRISPRDAQRGFSDGGYSDKVAGDALYHFGAFFKRSWRANDILWGRLDGICQITETLLTHDRVQEIVSREPWRAALKARLFVSDGGAPIWNPDLDPATLFPSAGAETHRRLRRWLEDLVSDDRHPAALDRFDTEIGILIEAAQLEAVQDELPRIAKDAIDEQVDWNQYQRATGKKAQKAAAAEAEAAALAPPWIFQAIPGRLDPFVATMASEDKSRRFLQDLARLNQTAARPQDTGLGQFFKKSYQVGSETLTRDIPAIVLLEILATALLVTHNCILALFGSRADRIRSSLLYKLCVSLPLRVFYWLTVTLRRSPAGAAAILIGLAVICLLALATALFFRDPLIHLNGVMNWRAFNVFVVAPIVILAVEIFIVRQIARRPEAPARSGIAGSVGGA